MLESAIFKPKRDKMIEQKMANTIRCLSLDMISTAKSGHPGVAMGISDLLISLAKKIKLNPNDPTWINRDRLIFSGGHASAAIYSFLYLMGFPYKISDLQSFRKLDSNTPGHPEFSQKFGIEITTGPLGQGIANAVGFALAQKRAQKLLGSDIINHKIYCFCGDGDLQEGISYEACSLAGLHNLKDLIIIYDSNNITIEGEAKIAFNEDIKARFSAQHFSVLTIDGHDFSQIDSALDSALNATKPTLIIAKTHIAKGAFELENSHKSHGAPFSWELVERIKENFGFDKNAKFSVDSSVKTAFSAILESNLAKYEIYQAKYKNNLDEFLNPDFSKIIFPDFSDKSEISTRASNGEILNAIAKQIKGFIGGSADLSPSNCTELKNSLDFPEGNNLHFGIREHAMGAIMNAFSAYGIFLPFCSTFFVFSDYMSPAVRIASISKLRVFYIWTHDSIGVGEDGATHQPIEHLSHFRAMPNLLVFRPADGFENIECWKIALNSNQPCAFVLSRQNLPLLTQDSTLENGIRILKNDKNPSIIFIASGSEVHLALESAKLLNAKNIATRVISAPCFDLLLKADKPFLDSIFFKTAKIIAIEAARGFEWYRFADVVINIDSFGKSASGGELFTHFGFNAPNIAQIAQDLL